MQLNNTDAFNRSYYSSEAEIYFFCSLILLPTVFSVQVFYFFSFFPCEFFFSNIINKNKILCVLLHVLYSKHDVFVLKIKKPSYISVQKEMEI